MGFHGPIHALGVDRFAPHTDGLALQKLLDPPIAIGRLTPDDRLDVAHEIIVGLRKSPSSDIAKPSRAEPT